MEIKAGAVAIGVLMALALAMMVGATIQQTVDSAKLEHRVDPLTTQEASTAWALGFKMGRDWGHKECNSDLSTTAKPVTNPYYTPDTRG